MLVYLLTFVNENDKEKVIRLYKLYRSTMLYVANGILHDSHSAEDAVSEAFIRIIKNIHKIDDVDCYPTRGFVVIIVRNISLNMLAREKPIEPLEDYEEYIDSKESVFDEVSFSVLREQVEKALQKLNQNYADILTLKIKYNLSNKETADVLGITPENAKMRLSGARKALKEQLCKEGALS